MADFELVSANVKVMRMRGIVKFKTCFLVIFFIFHSMANAQSERVCSNFSDESLRAAVKLFENAKSNDFDKNYFLAIPANQLSSCLDKINAHPDITPRGKDFIKRHLQETIVQNFENRFADNFRRFNLKEERQRFELAFRFINGTNKTYPAFYQQFLRNYDKFIADRKDACSEVTIETNHMGPIRNQRDLPWCFAFATADFLSFHAKKEVSALDVGILHNNFAPIRLNESYNAHEMVSRQEQYKQLFAKFGYEFDETATWSLKWNTYDSKNSNGGNLFASIEAVKSKGVCAEKDLPSREHLNRSMKHVLYAPLYEKNSTDFEDECPNVSGAISTMFPNLSLKQILEVIEKSSPDFLLYQLRNANCKNLVRLPQLNLKVENSQANFLDKIDRSLNQKKPALIAYDATLLFPDSNASHANTIVGRRFNPESLTCDYQLRNTWGPDDMKFKGTTLNQKNGLIWVNEEILNSKLLQVIY